MSEINTFFDCCVFLTTEKGTVSFAPKPGDATKSRLVVRAGDADPQGALMAAIEYSSTDTFDLLQKAFIPSCRELQKALLRRRLADV